MKTYRRSVLLTLLCLLAGAALAPAAHAIALSETEGWEAGTCTGNEATVKNCRYSSPHSAFYTQSAGHPDWGLTGFKVKQSGEAPEGNPIKRIRVDVPPGLAANPQVVPTCTRGQFEANSCPLNTKVGFVELKAYVEAVGKTLSLEGNVYNLQQEPGLPLLFGIDVKGVEVPLLPVVEDTHLFLEGHVSWGGEPSLAPRGIASGDFHEWFEINNVPTEVSVKLLTLEVIKSKLKTVESKLFFNGHAGTGGKENFLTMPSNCAAPTTSYLELETYPPTERLSAPTTPPVGVDGCD
jgi:hypothetical protein